MLEGLEGEVTEVSETGFVLRSGPLSLFLHASRSLLETLEPGMRAVFPVHLQLQIEGNKVVPVAVAFADELERELFDQFLGVSGVGAKAAVKALARPAAEIAAAIARGDEAFLSTLPGIGRARAKQIVASLQDKLTRKLGPLRDGLPAARIPAAAAARTILVQLGLSAREAADLVAEASSSLDSSADAGVIVAESMRRRNRT